MAYRSPSKARSVRAVLRSRGKKLMIIIGLVSATLVISIRLISEARQNSSISKEIADLERQAQEIEERNTELLALTKEISEVALAEREARLKLGLKKPGERVIVVEEDTKAAGTDDGASPLEFGNPERWWMYFFEHDRLVATIQQ